MECIIISVMEDPNGEEFKGSAEPQNRLYLVIISTKFWISIEFLKTFFAWHLSTASDISSGNSKPGFSTKLILIIWSMPVLENLEKSNFLKYDTKLKRISAA
jgi:hypothetical protein